MNVLIFSFVDFYEMRNLRFVYMPHEISSILFVLLSSVCVCVCLCLCVCRLDLPNNIYIYIHINMKCGVCLHIITANCVSVVVANSHPASHRSYNRHPLNSRVFFFTLTVVGYLMACLCFRSRPNSCIPNKWL